MKMKKILLGTDNFDKLIRENGYYVDKTEVIHELVQTGNEVTLFTRPRRFGKSLMMSMLESFFDIKHADSVVFDDLAIKKQYPEFCEKWEHQFPTILISLKDVEALTYETALKKLKNVIADLCKKHTELLDSDAVDSDDRDIFARLKSKSADLEEIENSLKTITRMMYAAYGKPVILLIDEYDVPLAKAQENLYYRDMLNVIRGIMSTALKSNEYLQFAVVTGCLRIPKESIFTGVNNFASYSVLAEEFSDCIGFTEENILTMLTYYGLEDKLDLVRKWYDGYMFGNAHMYCPWDAMSYVSALRKNRMALPEPYWENTSGHGAIKAFFELENEDVTDDFETLLAGGTIVENVSDALTYEDAYTSISNLWSVLLMTGYVTAVKQMPRNDLPPGQDNSDDSSDDNKTKTIETALRGVELRIPNHEISLIFQKSVVDHFNKTVDQSRISELMDSLWHSDEQRASEILSDLLFETISYMDYHEDYYHAFVAGIFAGRGYVPKSNREEGLGRPDVDLKDRRNRRRMIVECKKSESEERMDYWCDDALKQIVDLKYAGNSDGFNTVLCYGVAFYKKSAKVKLMK